MISLPKSLYIRECLARSLWEIAMQILWTRSLKELYTLDLCRNSLYKISVQYLGRRSRSKISAQTLYKHFWPRSLSEISIQDPCTRLSARFSLKVSVTEGLLVRSLWEISMQVLCTRSLSEVSLQDLSAWSLQGISWQGRLGWSLCKISEQGL